MAVRDYNEWVTEEDEMWLTKIQERIKTGEYKVYQQMLADVQQIHTNAVAYNTAGHGYSSGDEGDPSCRHLCMRHGDHEHAQRHTMSLVRMSRESGLV